MESQIIRQRALTREERQRQIVGAFFEPSRARNHGKAEAHERFHRLRSECSGTVARLRDERNRPWSGEAKDTVAMAKLPCKEENQQPE